jgi:hypothetical protein
MKRRKGRIRPKLLLSLVGGECANNSISNSSSNSLRHRLRSDHLPKKRMPETKAMIAFDGPGSGD